MTLHLANRTPSLPILLLAAFVLTIASAVSTAWASHFTGTYQDPGSRMLLALQHGTDASMQGALVLPDGSRLQLQGRGDQNGASGTLRGPQGQLEFRAQLSPDGRTLQLTLIQPGAQGGEQRVSMQRVADTPTLPNAPGGGSNGPGAPGTPPGPGTPAAPPTAPGSGPGAPTSPGATGPSGFPPSTGGATWNGTYVGNGGDLRLQLQQTPQGVQGVIESGGARYPLQARGDATRLEGSFQAPNGTFGLQVFRNGPNLVLVTGGVEYVLSPAAPGGGAGGSNPLGNP